MRLTSLTYRIFTVFAMFMLLISGCSDDTIITPSDVVNAPEIPPKSSFIIDFEEFPGTDSNSESINKKTLGTDNQTYKNWGWAASNLVVWNTLLTVTLAVPAASFVESFNHDPELQTDGSWLWSYTYSVLGQSYTAELHARLGIDGIQWEMYISKQNAYSKFLWYTGKSNPLTADGTWTLFKNPNDPSPFLGIEWDVNVADGTANIKYINIIPDSPEHGSYIYYGTTKETESPFDAFYEIYAKGKDNYTNIEWNRTSKDGRVSDVLHFDDSEWHCWNTQLEDTECQ